MCLVSTLHISLIELNSCADKRYLWICVKLGSLGDIRNIQEYNFSELLTIMQRGGL